MKFVPHKRTHGFLSTLFYNQMAMSLPDRLLTPGIYSFETGIISCTVFNFRLERGRQLSRR